METDTKKPIIRVENGQVSIHVPLADRSDVRYRSILIEEAAIARYLNVGQDQLGEHNLESFARNNLEYIMRRAIEVAQAKLIVPNFAIDAPRQHGLPDIICIKEGEL